MTNFECYFSKDGIADTLWILTGIDNHNRAEVMEFKKEFDSVKTNFRKLNEWLHSECIPKW